MFVACFLLDCRDATGRSYDVDTYYSDTHTEIQFGHSHSCGRACSYSMNRLQYEFFLDCSNFGALNARLSGKKTMKN